MAKRKSVNYPGYSHQNPIPNASRIGNIVMSSIMNGTEPGTRTIPPELASQVTSGSVSKPPAARPTTSSRSISG
jgi:2-iminobutanoate/2-iminopropanoate deaminase